MRSFCLILALVVLTGCQGDPGVPEPGLSFSQAQLAEAPVIIQRGERFYLRYRRALKDGGPNLLSVLCVKKTEDAGYYYFTIPVSHVEHGCLMERSLASDGLEDLARRGQIYWLDPDGTTHVIPVKPDA
jgi:hypothetical protein